MKTRIQRLGAERASCEINPQEKTVGGGRIEVSDSCSPFTAPLLSLPTKMLQKTKGNQDFLLGTSKNLFLATMNLRDETTKEEG